MGEDDSAETSSNDYTTSAVYELSPEGLSKRYLANALTPPESETSSCAPQDWLMPSGRPPAGLTPEVQFLTGVWRGGRPLDQLRRIAQYLEDHSEFDLIEITQVYVGAPDGPERIMRGSLGTPGKYPEPKPNPS